MAATYVHLAGRDVDNALLKAYGIEVKENNSEKIPCPRCSQENFSNTSYCSRCGMPLNMNAAVKVEDKRQEFEDKVAPFMELLKSDPELRAIISKKLATH